MECPIIHKVTEDSPFGQKGKCPFGHNDSGLGDFMKELNEESYKKLKKVMNQITQFYENGTNMKKGHYDQVLEEVEKLDADKAACEKQLASLDEEEAFKQHPKSKVYRKLFEAELEAFEDQRKMFEDKKKEFYDLWQWSTIIVKVCKWLENSLDHHCNKMLNLKLELEPLEELTEKEKEEYGKGLDEISYNLQESQDFFKASVDGRLKKYHMVEKAIIEKQLEIITAAGPTARSQHWEEELARDLEFVTGLLADDDNKTNRREKMLKNHAAFLAVLKFHKEELKHPFRVNAERQYDPKFDFNPAAVIAEHGGY